MWGRVRMSASASASACTRRCMPLHTSSGRLHSSSANWTARFDFPATSVIRVSASWAACFNCPPHSSPPLTLTHTRCQSHSHSFPLGFKFRSLLTPHSRTLSLTHHAKGVAMHTGRGHAQGVGHRQAVAMRWPYTGCGHVGHRQAVGLTGACRASKLLATAQAVNLIAMHRAG